MDMFDNQDGIKSRDRVKEHGEVYTPPNIVNDMLNLTGIKDESYRLEAKFLEPSCGNGNFLVEILKRKLDTAKSNSNTQEEFDRNVICLISNIYGVDILRDNIREAKSRLKSIIENYYDTLGYIISKDITKSIKYVMDRNIILGNTLENTMVTPVNGPLIYNEWKFNGDKIKRHSFKASHMDIELNCDYMEVDYNKIYTIMDKEENDIEL